MRNGRSKRNRYSGNDLLRHIESGYKAIPRRIQSAYLREDLVNELWLKLCAYNVWKPTKLQVKNASIDIFRMQTRYRRGQRHGSQLTNVPVDEIPERVAQSEADTNAEIADHMKDMRRRLGVDGLCIFLLSRCMEFEPEVIQGIMDYDPTSLLASSIATIADVKL